MADFFTIGHGRRSIDEFVSLLHTGGVDLVVDVRTVPRSRANPQFNKDTLEQSLRSSGIGYEHLASLGGLRKRQFDGPSPNGFWQNDSFRNYADYAMTQPFQTGLERLRQLGRMKCCAVMCAESVWWRCHRRIIADYLMAGGLAVGHLMDGNRIEPARLTEAATIRGDGSLTYPAGDGGR